MIKIGYLHDYPFQMADIKEKLLLILENNNYINDRPMFLSI